MRWRKRPVRLKVDLGGGEPAAKEYARAADVLEQGGIVAFPTETFYGLAVDPFNEEAVAALFRLKKRSLQKPLLVLAQNEFQLATLTSSVPTLYRALMQRFWPGPLTLVFPASATLPRMLTGGGLGVAIRISPHPVAQRLLAVWGRPVTATSANLSGGPAACTAEDVRRIFEASVKCVLDGGETPGGMSSTVVGLEGGRLRLIRAGAVDFSAVLQAGAED